jgi:hypothetical protein
LSTAAAPLRACSRLEREASQVDEFLIGDKAVDHTRIIPTMFLGKCILEENAHALLTNENPECLGRYCY